MGCLQGQLFALHETFRERKGLRVAGRNSTLSALPAALGDRSMGPVGVEAYAGFKGATLWPAPMSLGIGLIFPVNRLFFPVIHNPLPVNWDTRKPVLSPNSLAFTPIRDSSPRPNCQFFPVFFPDKYRDQCCTDGAPSHPCTVCWRKRHKPDNEGSKFLATLTSVDGKQWLNPLSSKSRKWAPRGQALPGQCVLGTR